MLYKRVETELVDAYQWTHAGTAGPGDLPLVAGEGRIVAAYARKGVHPNQKCSKCDHTLASHGWLVPVNLEMLAAAVDPDTGEIVEVAAPAVPEAEVGEFEYGNPAPIYPLTYAKAGEPDRPVNNKIEEAEAQADGYYLKASPVPEKRETPPLREKTFAERTRERFAGTAEAPAPRLGIDGKELDPTAGQAVCPGSWIVNYSGNVREVVRNDVFVQRFHPSNSLERSTFQGTPRPRP
jgi:hypothetical protein